MAISASSKILASDISGISNTANAAYWSSFIPKGINSVANSEQDTTAMWINLGPGVYWFSEWRLIDQPSQYGFLINYAYGSDIFQIWSCQPSGPVRFRQGNAAGWNITWNHNAAWADNCNWANGADASNVSNTLGIGGTRVTFNWNGQSGQPNWLWGGNDLSGMYVYNPSNFNVNYANSAGWANSAGNVASVSSATSYCQITGTSQNTYNVNISSNVSFGSIVHKQYTSNDRDYYRYYVRVSIPSGGSWVELQNGSIVSGGSSFDVLFWDSKNNTQETDSMCCIRIA